MQTFPKNGNNESGAGEKKIRPSSIVLPKGGGAIRGIGETFRPDAFTGSAGYSIGIPVTPARGFEPQLSIDYSSAGGNSTFGMGFSLSIPLISIRTEKGIPRYDSQDIYMCNGSELVLKDGSARPNGDGWAVTEYLHRLQPEFSLIQYFVRGDESYWRITTTDDTVSVFGRSNASRIYNVKPHKEAQIFQWLIDEATDARGNKIVYSYKSENADQVPDRPWEKNRSYNNKYIERIQYGNFTDAAGTERFAYQLIFDYGEYVLPGPDHVDPFHPAHPWKYRDDPFSVYTSGFEIRTCRLCRNILLFHLFEKELGEPCLVKSVHLDYGSSYSYNDKENPGLSLLRAASLVGYRRSGRAATDPYTMQSLPPVKLNFSAFDPPQKPVFQKLEINDAEIPGYLDNSAFEPIDLDSEGIAGLLYHNAETLYYYSAEGQGKYKGPGVPDPFPTDDNFESGTVSLEDLDGNGRLDLVVNEPGRNGYYLKAYDGDWQPYEPFRSYPTNLSNPDIERTGLNNTGKTDALVVGETHVTVYPCLGTAGYGMPVSVEKEPDLPAVKKGYLQEYVGFADIMGDGLPHRVKITNGSVECWPDLGYGNFGEKIVLGNPPLFEGDFDSTRLYLTDIDGSGTTDIVYVYYDRITVFVNHSGNYFSGAISVQLPEPYTYSEADRIQFSDIKGNGTNCLVFTKAGETMRHYYYDFVGEAVIDGKPQESMKPYLLIEVDNNMGAVNRISYCSSTKFYLEDKRSGDPWCTRLPFPVQVVEKVTVIDQIVGSRYVTSYKFHDGYYDAAERAFAGFGFVETWDSESYEEYAGHHPAGRDLGKEHFVPPVYSRSWYHTGARYDFPGVTANYKAHFFKGDPDAYDFPDDVFDESIFAQGWETVRQAYAALKGQPIRSEVYADDRENNPLLYQNPYTVTQSNSKVGLYQAKGDRPYAVFLVVPREHISYNYERDPKDPRVQQGFTLLTDAFGNTIQSCSVFLSRRPNGSPDFVRYPEQYQVWGEMALKDYVHPLRGFLYCDVSYQEKLFELTGIRPDVKGYFSFEGIKKQIDGHAAQAEQISWDKRYFWNWANRDAPPKLGVVSSPLLLHHTEDAVFTKAFTIDVFDGRLIDEKTYQDGQWITNIISTHGGYCYDTENGYWWDKGLVQYYLPNAVIPGSPPSFYLPCKTENTFALAPPVDSSLIKCTTATYDPYFLFSVAVTEQIDSNRSNTQTALTDYVTGQPKQLVDINGNTTQVLFDPLGQVIVSSLFGIENLQRAGGMTLYDDGAIKAQYQSPGAGSFREVIDDPEKFLQGAGSYFYYNLNGWMETRQPSCSIQLIRSDYWDPGAPHQPSDRRVMVSYADGLGRSIEVKQKTAGVENRGIVVQRWQVTGRTVYNNKGKPCEQYLPFFSAFPEYEDQKNIAGPPPTITRYDPLSRPVRVDTPKRFFSKVEFTPWQELHYDEDDTILDSWFYQHEYPGKLNKYEQKAIEKAVKFYNTPGITVIDSKGDAFLRISNNLGNVPKDAFRYLEHPGITSEDIWKDLCSKGYLALYPEFPVLELHFLTAKFQPYTPGFLLHLDPKYSGILQEITDILRQNCLTAYSQTDLSGRVLASADPRIYYGNIRNHSDRYNFKYEYPLTGSTPARIDSADAGCEKHLPNIFGSQLWTWSPREYCQLILYDRLQRQIALTVKKITTPGVVTDYMDFNRVETSVYGEMGPSGYNLRGRLYEMRDLSGIVINSAYTMLGQPLATSRQMLADYRQAADWKAMAPLLETIVYPMSFTYNAIGQLLTQTTPDGSITFNTYNEAGQLRTIGVRFPGNGSIQSVVGNIEYDANGQRTLVADGNGVVRKYTYEDTTLRLIRLKSRRPDKGNDPALIQDTEYYYDPVGNITAIYDNTADIIFCKNQRIDPLSCYTYDPMYRLIKATGRQHIGIGADTHKDNSPDSFKQCLYGPPPFKADSDKLENYIERYTYDESGNLIHIQHTAASGSWPRELPVDAASNRLQNGVYDASGNLKKLDVANTADLYYNCCENLVRTGIIQRPNEPDDCEYYLYDSDENRTRKVSERLALGGAVTAIEDKVYLGNFVVKRNLTAPVGAAAVITAERTTLRVMDGQSCVVVINYTVKDTVHRELEGSRQCRYQLENNIGSVCLELNEKAQLITYEEYFPYGGSSILTGSSKEEVKEKEYRYSGKECDDSTGLYYYGARYYVTWQGRWLTPDPAGTVDGMNLFAFVGGNPVGNTDERGLSKRLRGEEPEFPKGLESDAKKPRMAGGDIGRCKDAEDGLPTSGFSPTNKDYKTDLRVYWKGLEDDEGMKTGIVPYVTERDSKSWPEGSVELTHDYGEHLGKNPGFKFLSNGKASWGAELSHYIAGSLYGPNDVLSAGPASVHQNTEWLAIEQGVKYLAGQGLGERLRISVTGYVQQDGEWRGTIKSARYKIYIDGKKVFDHVALGERGNIDRKEFRALRQKVKDLTPESDAVSDMYNPLSETMSPPSLKEVKQHRTDSTSSPMFTYLRTAEGPITGDAAVQHMTDLQYRPPKTQ